MQDRERPSLTEGQRFEDISDAEMDVSSVPILIEDSNESSVDTGGFMVLPTKIPLGAILVFIVQCIITAVSLTAMYVEQKSSTQSLNEKLVKLEDTCYTKLESRYLEKEVAELKSRHVDPHKGL